MTTEEEVAKVYHTAVNLSKILHEEKKKYDSKVIKLIHDIEKVRPKRKLKKKIKKVVKKNEKIHESTGKESTLGKDTKTIHREKELLQDGELSETKEVSK